MTSTTIQLDRKVVDDLKEVREYPRQTYNDLIASMIKIFKALKNHNQYDEFLHHVQKAKMKELWDNQEDEVWERA